MDQSSIFITGADGQLGLALRQRYPGAQKADIDELDITKRESVDGFDWSKIKVIVNAAAYTNVDGAETPEGRVTAWGVNASAIANLVHVAHKNDAILVHISTDYVFDGSNTLHKENEPFSPLSVYGASKASGDITASLATKHYILRTSWVIGEGKNFVRTMLELGKKNVSPTVVCDQVGRPTFTSELVRAIDHLLVEQASFGTYNISNGGQPVSWADMARAIFEEAGYNLHVADTTTSEYFSSKPGSAPRPLNSVLDLSKIEATGFSASDWRESLSEFIKKELSR